MRFLLAIALAGLVAAYLSLRGGSLDGSVWEVRVRKDSFFSIPHKDTLIFDSGRLIVGQYAAKGWLPASYDSTDDGSQDVRSWSASVSRPDGTEEWHGSVVHGRMTGTILFRRINGLVQKFLFKGKPKPS